MLDTVKRIQDWVTQKWVILFYPGSGMDDLQTVKRLKDVVDEFHFVDLDEIGRGLYERFGSEEYIRNLVDFGFDEIDSPGRNGRQVRIPGLDPAIRTKTIRANLDGRIVHLHHFDCDYLQYMDWMYETLGHAGIIMLKGYQAGEGGSCFVDVFTDSVRRKGKKLPGYRDRLARICRDDVVIIDHDVLHLVRAPYVQQGWRFST